MQYQLCLKCTVTSSSVPTKLFYYNFPTNRKVTIVESIKTRIVKESR